jgi:hypothetical protein
MRIDGIVGYYLEDDIDMIVTRTINWINSDDNMKKPHTILAIKSSIQPKNTNKVRKKDN